MTELPVRPKDQPRVTTCLDSDALVLDRTAGTKSFTIETLRTTLVGGLAGTLVYRGAVAAADLPTSGMVTGDNYLITAPGTKHGKTWAIGDLAVYRSGSWDQVRAFFDRTINVRDYGAVGDGVTDDTAAVQAAYDAVPAAGGTLYFPCGKWRFNLTITRNNIRVLGDSFCNAVHAGDTNESYMTPFSSGSACITIGGSGWTHGVQIENCTFNGNDVTGLTAVRFKGGAFGCFLNKVAFFKFLKCVHLEGETGLNDLHHVFMNCWQMQVGTEASARGIYAKMANGQTPVTLSIFFSNGQMNGPTGSGSYGLEVDGTALEFTNCYIDLTTQKGVRFNMSGSGQLSPYINFNGGYLDVPGGGILVDVAHSNVALWESYIRGRSGINGKLRVANGTTVDSDLKTAIEGLSAYTVQITGELAFVDFSLRTGGGNFSYSNAKRLYASGSSLIIENTGGPVNLAPTGALNIAPQGAAGAVVLNGGTLGFSIAAGATAAVTITGGHLVLDATRGLILGSEVAVGRDGNNAYLAAPTAGGNCVMFGRHASSVFEVYPGLGTTLMGRIDTNAVSNETGLLLRANGSMKRVSLGAADSGGTGYRALRVEN